MTCPWTFEQGFLQVTAITEGANSYSASLCTFVVSITGPSLSKSGVHTYKQVIKDVSLKLIASSRFSAQVVRVIQSPKTYMITMFHTKYLLYIFCTKQNSCLEFS